ncbi:MAG TPA: chondroitinase-B domain-containing protein, partial [Oligoflexus sp.]|uniref:chondroitinase-B domain-containing protein n=1 Tax=Oligoflexus sp. TaxID=1971216 RepID=UPI002D4FD0DB
MKRFEIGVLSWLLVGGILGCESRSSDSNLADSGRGPRIFHVDSVAGSDVSPGTSPETPWQSLNKINAMKLLPGDVVRLKRGSAWDIGLVVKDSGTPEAPITIEAYGDENKPVQEMKSPVIENSGAGRWGAAVELKGSYIIVEGLLLRNANARGVMINEGADHNIIRHNEITNVGIGVQVFGKFNLVTRNFVHDLHMIVNDQRDPNKPRSGANDFGANCFWLENTDNELSYNRGENCVAPSFDYGRDGGFVELFGV